MIDLLKHLNPSVIFKDTTILIPGFSFLFYLIYLIDKIMLSVNQTNGLFYSLLGKESILFFVILLASFAIGSYIYLFSLRIYSKLFSIIFPEGMDDKDPAHNYWRYFSISISFTLFILIFTEIIFLSLNADFIFFILLFVFIISHIMTYLLHNDIKLKKGKKNLGEKWKSFVWDYDGVNKKYYSLDGLIVIIGDQQKRIEQLEKHE